MSSRKIIHVDMDAFYASVEQRDHPELRGKPVIVGGAPDSRGVVSTCSYEARRFGVKSAMAASLAQRLCPHGVFLRPRFKAYKEVSSQVQDIFLAHSDRVEPLSLDEAYLDVTTNKLNQPSATRVAQSVLTEIRRVTGLTASAGVSYCKFLAKVASDINKPNGLTVITPERALDFIAELPIERFHGVGKVTAEKARRLGIHNGADLRALELETLVRRFGKFGHFFLSNRQGG